MEANKSLRAESTFTLPALTMNVCGGVGRGGRRSTGRRQQEVLLFGWTKTGIDTKQAGRRSETLISFWSCWRPAARLFQCHSVAPQLENIRFYCSKGNVYWFIWNKHSASQVVHICTPVCLDGVRFYLPCKCHVYNSYISTRFHFGTCGFPPPPRFPFGWGLILSAPS